MQIFWPHVENKIKKSGVPIGLHMRALFIKMASSSEMVWTGSTTKTLWCLDVTTGGNNVMWRHVAHLRRWSRRKLRGPWTSGNGCTPLRSVTQWPCKNIHCETTIAPLVKIPQLEADYSKLPCSNTGRYSSSNFSSPRHSATAVSTAKKVHWENENFVNFLPRRDEFE